MVTDLLIRRAVLTDAPAIAEAHCRAWEAAYTNFLDADFIAQRNAGRLARWQENLSGQNNAYETWVPVVDKQVAGLLGLGLPQEDDLDSSYYELCGLYLHPAYFRRGIGRQLVNFAFARAQELGKTSMILYVFEENASSRRFYEDCGFAPDGIRKLLEFGKPVAALRYAAQITQSQFKNLKESSS